MKKAATLAASALLIACLLASCASAGSSSRDSSAAAPEVAPAYQAPVADEALPTEKTISGALRYGADEAAAGGGAVASTVPFTEKIIYSYSAQIETTDFEGTIKNVSALIAKYGAFIENSYISGNGYSKKTFRTADYTIRVPAEKLSAMTGEVSTLGNVVSETTTAQNITMQFTDTESRLKAYRTEESRLLAMLEKAETVEDMIAIETRLSDVRYQIESLTSTLKNWQNQVDYSTVSLHIAEVEKLTEQVPAQRSYLEQLRDGFLSTLKGIGEFFKTLFIVIVAALPVLVLLALAAAAALLIVRAVRRRKNRSGPQGPGGPQDGAQT